MFSHPLARELTIILILKAAIVLAAGIFVFGPRQRPPVNPDIVEVRMLDQSIGHAADNTVKNTNRSSDR